MLPDPVSPMHSLSDGDRFESKESYIHLLDLKMPESCVVTYSAISRNGKWIACSTSKFFRLYSVSVSKEGIASVERETLDMPRTTLLAFSNVTFKSERS
jgi:hypothetical protein